jgi:hypothetical protein
MIVGRTNTMKDGRTTTVRRASVLRRGRWFGVLLGVAVLVAAAVVTGAGPDTDRARAANRDRPVPSRAGLDSAEAHTDGKGEGSRQAKGSVGWDAFRSLDGLSRLRSGEQSRQFSSFARDGSNDDGFNGTYSCLHTTDRGCVIAEHSGPGEISSMWFTRDPLGDVSATGQIIVELDGKTVLDAPLTDVVNGRQGAPFVWPLVGNNADTSGGAVIKVPMPFRESMRVTVQNNPRFYHVDYRTFPDADGVQTFDPSDQAQDVIDRLRHFGVADPKPAAAAATVASKPIDLAPGASTQVAQLSGPAQINQLRLNLPQVIASPQVVDDGLAFGAGGGSRFQARVAPDNQGVRITRRFDAQIADQVANLSVDGQPVGQWRSGPAAPGQWGVQTLDVPASATAGKSSIMVDNRFVSSALDFNEFRYDVHCLVNGQWVRTDVLDLGPAHPGEQQAHDYSIDNQTFTRDKLIARYPVDPARLAASQDILSHLRLRIGFDGQTTVDAPIGEFFGSGLGDFDVRSLMSAIDAGEGGWYTSWWPMPFRRNATVELVNDSHTAIQGGTGEVSSAPADMGSDQGYFHATHQSGRTEPGKDWNFLTAQGSGTFYGVTQTMSGLIAPDTRQRGRPRSLVGPRANLRDYLEGDERFYVDGSPSPAWHGTGTEDFYESGWYFRDGTTYSMPMAGNPAYEAGVDGCQFDCTGAYRLMLPDAVPFRDGFVAGIQHGPDDEDLADYSSTAYWYGGLGPGQHTSDTVDLADSGNRTAHAYHADGETVGPLNSSFEGGLSPAPFSRTTTTATGGVTFQVRLQNPNSGVRLRRLGDQDKSYQQAEVRVDGQPAGTWLEPLGNPYQRWLEDVFDIPPALTAGKSSVRVELVPVNGAPGWSASRYTVFTR